MRETSSSESKPLFERFIAVDWSGAKRSSSLAVAETPAGFRLPSDLAAEQLESCVVAGLRTRPAVTAYLREKLRPSEPPTLVMIDAGFTYPFGTARALFDLDTQPGRTRWHKLVRYIAAAYRREGSARKVGEAINEGFGHADKGPFRTNESRNAPDFYAEHRVGYFRQAEMLAPQAISPFYLGSGASVGFSTISLLGELDVLMDARDEGELDFEVWIHETFDGSQGHHLLAETYPSLFKAKFRGERPSLVEAGRLNAHEQDAVACINWLQSLSEEQLADLLCARRCPVGRHEDCASWQEQLHFEGWILGVPWPRDEPVEPAG